MLTKPAIITLAILGFVAITTLWGVGNYNSLISSRNQVEKSWGGVEVQYQRRLDLIDNLVESVKGSQKQEIAVFGEIARARSLYNSATNSAQKAEAANQIETNIALIPRLQEAYPELKSNENVKSLMLDLKGTENDILGSRTKFNDTAANYNANILSFPKNLFASIFKFEKQPLFKSQSGADQGSKVKF